MTRGGDDGSGESGPRRRRSLLGWLARRLVFSLVVMALLSLVGIGYLAHRDRTLLEEAARGLEAVAEKLEQGDRDSAAESLRGLASKLERLDETSGDYSDKVNDALARARGKSEDLYDQARRAIRGGEGDGSGATDAPDAGSDGDTGADAPADSSSDK